MYHKTATKGHCNWAPRLISVPFFTSFQAGPVGTGRWVQFGRDVALARVVALPHADPVEPHQVAAVVALQLLDVKQEGLDFAEGQARVLVDQKGAVIDAGLEQPVAALLPALGTDLI